MSQGQIFSFYSFKGGVGRSMALANIAMLFYQQGFKTLVVDWDLEAPGLERYFTDAFGIDAQAISDSPGLIDLIDHYMDHVARSSSDENEDLFPDICPYLRELDSQDEAKFLLMHAGRRSSLAGWDRYTDFVQTFNWGQFYDEWAGGAFFDWLRSQFSEHADVILIDSRTGVTEMGGVATQHLADVIVLLCGANIQNIENSARMAHHFSSQSVRDARGDRPLELIVAPSRIDDSDSDRYNEFLDRFEQAFAETPMRALDDGYSMQQMLIPYFPLFSFTEALVISNPAIERAAHRLREAYRRIMSNMKRLALPGSNLISSPLLAEGSAIHVGLIYVRADAAEAKCLKEHLQGFLEVIDLMDKAERPFEGLAAANALVLLLGEHALESELIRNFLSWSLDENKPIFPVLLPSGRLPLEIAGLQPLQAGEIDQSTAKVLARAIQNRLKVDSELSASCGDELPEIYLSFASVNHKRATKIAEKLRHAGFRVWSRRKIRVGSLISTEIESAIERAAAMVVLVSSSSSQSRTATLEWNMVRLKRKPLIPVRIFQNAPMPFLLADTKSETCLEEQDMDALVERVRNETTRLKPAHS